MFKYLSYCCYLIIFVTTPNTIFAAKSTYLTTLNKTTNLTINNFKEIIYSKKFPSNLTSKIDTFIKKHKVGDLLKHYQLYINDIIIQCEQLLGNQQDCITTHSKPLQKHIYLIRNLNIKENMYKKAYYAAIFWYYELINNFFIPTFTKLQKTNNFQNKIDLIQLKYQITVLLNIFNSRIEKRDNIKELKELYSSVSK